LNEAESPASVRQEKKHEHRRTSSRTKRKETTMRYDLIEAIQAVFGGEE